MKSINMKELLIAMEQLEKEEGMDKEFLLDALKTALEIAYQENYDTEEIVTVDIKDGDITVSYTHLTLPTTARRCRSRWSPYH